MTGNTVFNDGQATQREGPGESGAKARAGEAGGGQRAKAKTGKRRKRPVYEKTPAK